MISPLSDLARYQAQMDDKIHQAQNDLLRQHKQSQLENIQAAQQMQNSIAAMTGMYGALLGGSLGTFGSLGAGHAQTSGTGSSVEGAGLRGKPASAAKAQTKPDRASEAAASDALDSLWRESERPKLSLKTSPLFGYMRWRFDSPFKPLEQWILRVSWKLRRT